MRRIENDPDEQRDIADAISRAALPSHEQPTDEFDSLAHLFPFNRGLLPRPEERTWSPEQEAWVTGIEEEHET